MIKYQIEKVESNYNKGENVEISVYAHFQQKWQKDNKSFDIASDLVIEDKNISIKSSHFSLCNNLRTEENTEEEFNRLLKEFFTKVHSNVFMYVTKEYICYEMNTEEFYKFLLLFSHLEKTDEKDYKIRGKRNENTIIQYLNNCIK